jgi:acyl-CoA dehydrogenase
MDYEIPENLRLMVDTVRRFVKQDLEPISRQVEDEDRIPEDVVQTMRDLGLFGLAIPEEYGGLEVGLLGECLVYEEMSKANACFRTRIGTNNGIGAQGIIMDGTPEQKQRYLPKLASGEWTGCFALSEPEAGSDAANVQTTAELKDGHWVLNGRKHFITNGDIADIASVFALTDRSKKARGGITAFIVEKTFPVFTWHIERNGLAAHTCELIFDDCQVPTKRDRRRGQHRQGSRPL